MSPQVVLLISLLALACGARGSGETGAVVDPIEVGVTTDLPSYAPGATVTATLVVRNRGDGSVILPFTSGQRYDFELRDVDGELLWRWGEQMGFIQALGQATLGPRDTLWFVERIVAPSALGRYTLVGMLTTRDRLRRATTTFEVK